jgi:hypothetical protein
MSAEPYRIELLVAHEGREQDAEDSIDALSRKHGLRLDGDHPRYQLDAGSALSLGLDGGSVVDPLRALLVDLVHDGAIRNLALLWHVTPEAPTDAAVTRLEIGDFIARSKDRSLDAGVWYRLHAPAGYRCRP